MGEAGKIQQERIVQTIRTHNMDSRCIIWSMKSQLYSPEPAPSSTTHDVIKLILLLSIFTSAAGQDLIVLPTNTEINAVTNYTLMLNYFTYTVPAGSTLALTFPQDYSPTILNNKGPYSGYDPALGDFCFPACTFTQAVPAGNTLLINGLFTQNIDSINALMLQLTLFNITNPNSLNPGQFLMTIYKGTSIYYPTGTGSSVSTPTFTVSTMPYSTQIFTSSIWATSVLRITLTPNTLIDTVQLNFPSTWTNETVSTNVRIGAPTCSSPTHPSLTCGLVGAVFQVANIGYITAGDPITIDIHSIYNPTSIVGIGSVSASGIYLGTQLTTASVSLPASSFSEDILRQITLSTTQQTTTLSITISFSLPHISMSSDTFTITFPSELTMPTLASAYSITGPYTSGTPSLTFTSGNNSLSFQPFSTTFISKASLTITVSGISRPRECKTLSNFVIATFRMGSYLMEYSPCCQVTLSDRQTLLSSVPTLSSSARLASSVTYTFNITTNHVNLKTTDKLIIQFPSDYSQQVTSANSATLCSSVTVSSATDNGTIHAPTCSVTLNTITLSSFLTADRVASDSIIVVVPGLTNPSSSPGPFQLSTVSTNSHLLQTVKGLSVSIVANTLTSFTVTPNSYTTYNKNTIYSFGIGNNAAINNGYFIRIDLPADIPQVNYNAMQCTVAGGSMPCSRLDSTYGTTTHSIIVSVNSIVATIGTVTVSGVTNPASLAPSNSFKARIIDKDGNTVQSSINSPSVTMITMGTFLAVVASTYNTSYSSVEQMVTLLNQQTSISLFIITPFMSQYGNSTLYITLANISFLSTVGSSCSSSQFGTGCTISTVGSNLVATLTGIVFSTSTNYIALAIGPVSISNNQDLSITAKLTINGYDALTNTVGAKVGQMYAQPVSNFGIVQTNYIMGVSADVTLSINLVNNQTASTVSIFIPQQYSTANHQITVNFTQLPISLTLTNPSSQVSSPFLFVVFNQYGHPMAYSFPNSTQQFSLACVFPCRTCDPANASHCLSCYTSISWISEHYLQGTTNTCVSFCSSNEYLSAGSCLACSASCQTCLTYGNTSFSDGLGTTCLTCNSSSYLLNTSCYSVCPEGHYPSGNICTACMSNCLSCTNYSSCTACLSAYNLFGGQCLTVCPQGYLSVAISLTNASCSSCPANCLACSSISTCTTCQHSYFLSSGLCVPSCSAPFLPNYLNKCTACECLTCSAYSYNCTACGGILSLQNNQCLTQCLAGYYSSNNMCNACMDNCAACSSATFCSICYLPYLLLYSSPTVSACLSSCPSGTIATINPSNFSYLCAPCDSPCLTCQTNTDQCTSCSSPLLLTNGNCSNSCPSGQFSFGGKCVTCYPECSSCSSSDPTICFSCSGGYFLSATACLSSCPNGTYPQISTLYCARCSNLCATCLNSSHCTSCSGGYFLRLNLCYSSCTAIDPLYYSYGGQCLYCQRECQSCFPSSPYKCVSCSDSHYFYNPTTLACTSNCSPPYYTNGNQCALCSPPCATCDTAYNACQSCLNGLVAYVGSCLSSCPQGFKNELGVCTQCSSDCLVCNSLRCTTCQPYAYLYHDICVMDCSVYSDLPITVNNYCTNCQKVPQCQQCSSSPGVGFTCFLCVYPYVVFNGECLNQCPDYYQPDSELACQQTAEYAQVQTQLYQQNKPKLPPFSFLIILVVTSLVLVPCARRRYFYTYHQGYLLTLSSLMDFLTLIYSLYYISSLYQGEYTLQHKELPLLVLAASFLIKFTLTLFFTVYVVGCYYLGDLRYREWKGDNQKAFLSMVILTLVLGPRGHKLYYSKLWQLPGLSYRILSVQKFYPEDVVNWLLLLPDLLDISVLAIVAYNIFITYAVLYLVPFQAIAIKAIIWTLFFWDLKKPDRGFFLGDEEQAEKEIKMEEENAVIKQRKFQMQNLAKLIRCQSAGAMRQEKLYEFLFFDDFRSVYNPSDYEDPPKVPKKKIHKNIQRGRFRKGKKISIAQKLRRFAQSIKPAPKPKTDDAYLNNLIYWKPPKQMKVKPKLQPKETEESMLNLLRDKELYYESELKQVEIEDIEEEAARDGHNRRKGNRLVFEFEDETIGNQTFYEPTSIEHLEAEEYDDYNGLMNINYAKRQHLPHRPQHQSYDEQELRILRHSPLKKRPHRSKMNELSIRRG